MIVSLIWSKTLKKLRGKAVRRSRIDRTARVLSGSNIIDSTMGRYSYCGYDCTIVNCEIGAFTSIAEYVSIGDASHPMDWVSMSPVFNAGRNSLGKNLAHHVLPPHPKTYIGNDVWIGKGSLIKAGVRIGNGAVVGMGSVVTRDIEAYAIVAGTPARLIRKRFDDATIERLSGTQWWDLSDKDLQKLAEYIPHPDQFIKMKEDKVEKSQ